MTRNDKLSKWLKIWKGLLKASIMAFVVLSCLRVTRYLINPEIFISDSAPWYTDIIVYSLSAAIFIDIAVLGIVVIKHKIKEEAYKYENGMHYAFQEKRESDSVPHGGPGERQE